MHFRLILFEKHLLGELYIYREGAEEAESPSRVPARPPSCPCHAGRHVSREEARTGVPPAAAPRPVPGPPVPTPSGPSGHAGCQAAFRLQAPRLLL